MKNLSAENIYLDVYLTNARNKQGKKDKYIPELS